MNEPRRPEIEPLQTNDTATILVGTALWAAALVVLLIIQPSPDHQWWIWTCVAGIGGGAFGLLFIRRRDRKRPPGPTQQPIEPSTTVPPG
ncbi:DUF2530 domain-containing protein [Streptosporangium soli]|nr:DUF2530 domain-containing protein [Streptosporangium sp. KLBMP 9127]